MLEEAIDRIAPLIPRENVLIATSALLAEPIRKALPNLPPENVIGEPEKRNTAACLALAAAHLEHRFGDPANVAMAVLTADHQIGEPDRFRATVAGALEFAFTKDALVTIGVRPTRAETGYGYVEVAEAIPGNETRSDAVPSVRPVLHFREKPDRATAETYVASGKHLWNSGMFFWKVSTFLDGLSKSMPDLREATRGMVRSLEDSKAPSIAEIFGPLADVSIDYGLMERAPNVHVIPANFYWDDVGAWDALTRTRRKDAAGNVSGDEAVLIDAKDCIVYDEHDASGGERAIAVIGLSDIIVASTPDGILVCRKDRAQDVKLAVAELRRRGREHLT